MPKDSITFRDNDGGGPYTVKVPTPAQNESYKQMRASGMSHDKAWGKSMKEHENYANITKRKK